MLEAQILVSACNRPMRLQQQRHSYIIQADSPFTSSSLLVPCLHPPAHRARHHIAKDDVHPWLAGDGTTQPAPPFSVEVGLSLFATLARLLRILNISSLNLNSWHVRRPPADCINKVVDAFMEKILPAAV